MKTRLTGSLLGFSLAPAFFTRVDRFAPKAGCDVRHGKFSPMQFLQLVNSSLSRATLRPFFSSARKTQLRWAHQSIKP